MSKLFKCPICSKETEDRAYLPFCSARCKQVDLGHWLTGTYVIPTPLTPEEEVPETLENDSQ